MVVVLVTGGRDFNNATYMWQGFNAISHHVSSHISGIVQGGARGADTLAKKMGNEWGIPVHEFPADWGTHGKSAGFMRNKQMLDSGLAHVVMAMPGGRGTDNMVQIAKRAQIQVFDFRQNIVIWNDGRVTGGVTA
jgi:hypothetical protein